MGNTVRLVLRCIAVSVLAAWMSNCGRAPEPDESVAPSNAALFSRYIDTVAGNSAPPFTAAHRERSLFWARTVMNTAAFTQCVTSSANAYYMNLDDPNKTLSLASQISLAEQYLTSGDNALEFDQEAGTTWGYVSTPTDYGLQFIHLGADYRADISDWWNCHGGVCYPGASGGTNVRYQPWNWHAGGIVHEYTHSRGYRHMDTNCVGGGSLCSDPNCAWTTACLGAGTTPPATLNWAACDLVGGAPRGCQEYAAVMNGRSDSCYYRTKTGVCCGAGVPGCGDPSMPYIVSNCVAAVIAASDANCGDTAGHGSAHNILCGADQMRYVTGWTGTYLDSQTSSCECVADPRHQIALRTYSSSYNWTAQDGGGSSSYFNTHWTWATGAWQFLYANELGNRQGWYAGDAVELKSFNGQFTTTGFTPTTTSPSYLYFTNAYNSTYPIVNGSPVYVGTGGGYYAWDNGSQITPHYFSGTPDTNATFWLTEPKISLVYLRSYSSSNFVNVASDGKVYDTISATTLNYGTAQYVILPSELDQPTVELQAQAAFWLIDWNGGDLTHGDVVSLQAYGKDQWSFVNTLGSSGQVSTFNSAGYGDGNFTVRRISGSGVIPNNDLVSLQTQSNSKYLTTVGTQIQNSGTSVGTAQEFRVVWVHLYDYNRAAAW